MDQAPSTTPARTHGLQAAQAAATLLPVFALAAPGDLGPLAGDLGPEWTAAGLGLLLALPASLLLLVRRSVPRPAGAWWLLLFIAAGAASLALRPPADSLGASRALLTLFCGLLMFLSGASLDATGRAWLARGAVLLTVWLLGPVFTGAVAPAGVLGNSGSTSETALVGAVVGLWFGARGQRDSWLWSWLGAGAALALAVYAGWAPALAGMLCLGLAIAFNSLLCLTANEGRWRAAALGLACVFVFGVAWVRTHAPFPTESVSTAAAEPAPATEGASAADLLGGEVRLRIWRGVAHMVRDYGALGAGPGQFGAAFPPYRDPGEIALSSAPELGRETEVEHAHNDWLQGFADAGPGGLAWALFLLTAGWRALRSLRDPELARSALAAATLAILANALLRSPFSFNPASAVMFALLGATSARDSVRAGKLGAGLLVVSVLLVLGSLPRALALAAHGRALASVLPAGDQQALDRALDACPDSPQALALRAQLWKLTGHEEDPERSLANWGRVLEVRPHRLVGWMEVGRLHAQAGDLDGARAAWGRALTLAPRHPIVTRNLARLEAGAGDVDAALRWLEQGGDSSPELLLAIASDAVLTGANVEAALALASRAEPQRPALAPRSAWNLAQTLEQSEPFRARWLKGAAHLAWAREHRAAGDLEQATRSYRQALRALWFRRPGSEQRLASDALLLEFAATLSASGHVDDARAELERLRRPDSAQRAPDWVRTSLTEAGLLPGS